MTPAPRVRATAPDRLHRLTLALAVVGTLAFVYDFGYTQPDRVQRVVDLFYFIVAGLGLASAVKRLRGGGRLGRQVWWFDLLHAGYCGFVLFLYLFVGEAFETDFLLEDPGWIITAVLLTVFREASDVRLSLTRAWLNPAQLFIASFAAMILLGSLLLMLPRATVGGISFAEASFTATSAVCVTGLIVVDTATFFTPFGKTIILLLIQVGGLGILTFASYFSYFFTGGSTYENQLSLAEMSSSSKIGDAFRTLKYIIVTTATIEAVSAALLFLTLDAETGGSLVERAFFAVFHSVSAFCNAGFSTLSLGLYDPAYRFRYGFQVIVAATFILGGLGFPIVANVLAYARHRLRHLAPRHANLRVYRPWVLNLNSRITLVTTAVLTAAATAAFLLLERHHTLAEHAGVGKLVTAFFLAATPRTAGFNTVDMAALAFPTVVVTYLLMWIGASPASTGGGIKTSTIAVATLNIVSLARGRQRIEVFRREIAEVSVRRAFATISLSLIAIGLGVTAISVLDPEVGLLAIGFECFSAYSTVGLSLGVTAALSEGSRLVLMALMFVGRVSMLSVMVAVVTKVRHLNYHYPKEELTIN